MCWGGSTVFELDSHCLVRTFHEESKGERGSVSMAGENGRMGPGRVRIVVARGVSAGLDAYLTSFILICALRTLRDCAR